jgi:excisionase family DNA binding protein
LNSGGAETMDKRKARFVRYGLPTAVLDVKETAAYFGITSRQVYRLVRSGELTHTRVGLSLRFRIDDLDRYLSTRTTQTWARVDKRGRPSKNETRPPQLKPGLSEEGRIMDLAVTSVPPIPS